MILDPTYIFVEITKMKFYNHFKPSLCVLKAEKKEFIEKISQDDIESNSQSVAITTLRSVATTLNNKLESKKNTFIEKHVNENQLNVKFDHKKCSSGMIKCRSAPVSPIHHLRSQNTTKIFNAITLDECCKKATSAVSSFIYDINLYNDPKNVLFNEVDELDKSLMQITKYGKKSKNIEKKTNQNRSVAKNSSPCNSSTSSFASIKLEPLIINEEETSVNLISIIIK